MQRRSSRAKIAIFMNPHSAMMAQSDKGFSAVCRYADWIFPDGIGVALASLVCRGCAVKRVTGRWFIDALRTYIHENEDVLRVFLVAPSKEALEGMCSYLCDDVSSTKLAGIVAPHREEFGKAEFDTFRSEIAKFEADILLVGLSAPKQEKVIFALRDMPHIKLMAGIGAVFDYNSGIVPAPPRLITCIGMEWAWRLALQPRRLWRRTVVSGFRFVWGVLLIRIKGWLKLPVCL